MPQLKKYSDIQGTNISLKKQVLEHKGRAFNQFQQSEDYVGMQNKLVEDLPTIVDTYKRLRKGGDNGKKPMLSTFGAFINNVYGFETTAKGGFDQYLTALGVNPKETTISELSNMGQLRGVGKWLVPELVLEAIRLGTEGGNLSALIANRIPITTPTKEVPHVNMADATPRKVGEGERTPMGKLTFGSKTVSTEKISMGVTITDEVRQFTSIDMLAAKLSSVGQWMSVCKNSFLIETLLNGEQSSGNYSAPAIGVTTPGTFTYKDIRRLLIRMQNLQYNPASVLSNEANGLDISLLPEVIGLVGNLTLLGLVKDSADIQQLKQYYHGLMSSNQLLFIDGEQAITELVSSPLLIESDRDIATGTDEIVVSERIGYFKNNRDSAVILDKSLDFAAAGFPAWMDIEAFQRTAFRGA